MFIQCTDFTCCGLHLADLHELLEHFEESHVVVVAADGTPVYPCFNKSTTLSTRTVSAVPSPLTAAVAPAQPRAPYSSLVFNYPQPDPHPPPPAAWPTTTKAEPAHIPGPDPFPMNAFDSHSRGSSADAMEVDVMADFDAFDTDFSATLVGRSHVHTHPSSSQSSLSSSSSHEPLALPPSSFTVGQGRGHRHKHRQNRAQQLRGDSFLFEEHKGLIGLASEMIGGVGVGDRRRLGSQQGQRVPKKREKMFRCPVGAV
jgi:hypothetical protein